MTTYPAQYGFEEFSVPKYSLDDAVDDKNVFAITILEGDCAGETLSIFNVSWGEDEYESEETMLEFDVSSSISQDDPKHEQIVEIAHNVLKSVICFTLDNASEGADNEDVAS